MIEKDKQERGETHTDAKTGSELFFLCGSAPASPERSRLAQACGQSRRPSRKLMRNVPCASTDGRRRNESCSSLVWVKHDSMTAFYRKCQLPSP